MWNVLETGKYGNEGKVPTPEQVHSEVWMSLIHGSMGIVYFVHQFKTKDKEADDNALLATANFEMKEAVSKINSRIQELAPVLNTQSSLNAVTVTTRPRSLSSPSTDSRTPTRSTFQSPASPPRRLVAGAANRSRAAAHRPDSWTGARSSPAFWITIAS